MSKIYKTIDLFAGIGGIRMGFENTGHFETVFSNDYEEECKKTYDLNFDSSKLEIDDIRNIKSFELPQYDILLAGFPCQPFSVAGYRQGFKDKKSRGDLFFQIIKILVDTQPVGFLLENVKNLENHDKGNTFRTIKDSLKEIGYNIKFKILNTKEYGDLPQNRERIYIVGFKDKNILKNFKFPGPIKLTKSIRDLLQDENEIDGKYYYNKKPLYDRIKDDIVSFDTVYQWRRKYVRENKNNVCPTLTANMGTGGHNVPLILDKKGIRKLTPRECARFQGFSDDYKLPEIADSKLYKQFGNSVSIPVVKRVAEEMFSALKNF